HQRRFTRGEVVGTLTSRGRDTPFGHTEQSSLLPITYIESGDDLPLWVLPPPIGPSASELNVAWRTRVSGTGVVAESGMTKKGTSDVAAECSTRSVSISVAVVVLHSTKYGGIRWYLPLWSDTRGLRDNYVKM
ncbi:hypothetical protein C8Q80DRAFT_1139440, partial [Daedaleopsis nitida]